MATAPQRIRRLENEQHELQKELSWKLLDFAAMVRSSCNYRLFSQSQVWRLQLRDSLAPARLRRSRSTDAQGEVAKSVAEA